MVMGIFVLALYTMHNSLRHSGGLDDFNATMCRIMAEIYMKPAVYKVWEDYFGFHPRINRRPPLRGSIQSTFPGVPEDEITMAQLASVP